MTNLGALPTDEPVKGYPVALTGALDDARFVGGTTSGPPVSGTFSVGDYVVDQSGAVWICTVAGSPGTWGDMSSGKELAYAIYSDAANLTKTSGAAGDMHASLSVTFTVGVLPVTVCGAAGIVANTNASVNEFFITDESDNLKQNCGYTTAANAVFTFRLEERIAVAGTYTRKLRFKTSAGTLTVFADSASNKSAPFIKAVQN